MSIGSHPAAEPEALMAEPDDHGDDRECDLEPVLDRALEVMRHKATQLVQTTKTMLIKYNEDAVKLDALITEERERLEINLTRMQRAKSLCANFTQEITSSIASPERQTVCT